MLEAGDVQESSQPRVSRYLAPEAIEVVESSTIGRVLPVVMLPNIPALLRLMSRGCRKTGSSKSIDVEDSLSAAFHAENAEPGIQIRL